MCINRRTPGSVPTGKGAPEVHLMKPSEDLFPAQFCDGGLMGKASQLTLATVIQGQQLLIWTVEEN